MRMGNVAGAVGRGLFAGVVGTAAMTVSSSLEMKLRGREASSAPAAAAAKVLGIEAKGDAEKARFSSLVHWGYGTGWGAARGLLGAIGLPGPWAGAAHLAMVWGGELVMLPRLEVAPPVKEWGAKELAIDAWHHSVYTTATSLAFAFLSRPERTSKSAACRLGSSRRSR
ncbi:MAG: hypothetical protein H0V52_04615 [Acidimicrobiia bacterium]|nr:hypothetical protein [Acidimicrobiia bacterium]